MSPEVLLKGTFLALEQCGLLLRDANILYQNGSYASTIVLAAFAHEELGRHRMLLDFWRRARSGKGTFTAVQIKKACDDHVTKQRHHLGSASFHRPCRATILQARNFKTLKKIWIHGLSRNKSALRMIGMRSESRHFMSNRYPRLNGIDPLTSQLPLRGNF